MFQQQIKISEKAKKVMLEDALATFPNECCGFFYGKEDTDTREILEAQIVINKKEGDQRRRFEIAPFDYMKAERYALANNLTLLGVYHSHPNHPAIPSIHDLAKALPYFSYIIISVLDGKIDALRSWQLKEEKGVFEEETIIEENIVKI